MNLTSWSNKINTYSKESVFTSISLPEFKALYMDIYSFAFTFSWFLEANINLK